MPNPDSWGTPDPKKLERSKERCGQVGGPQAVFFDREREQAERGWGGDPSLGIEKPSKPGLGGQEGPLKSPEDGPVLEGMTQLPEGRPQAWGRYRATCVVCES